MAKTWPIIKSACSSFFSFFTDTASARTWPSPQVCSLFCHFFLFCLPQKSWSSQYEYICADTLTSSLLFSVLWCAPLEDIRFSLCVCVCVCEGGGGRGLCETERVYVYLWMFPCVIHYVSFVCSCEVGRSRCFFNQVSQHGHLKAMTVKGRCCLMLNTPATC